MWQERLNEFVTLFLVVNPIAVLPVFLTVTSGLDRAVQRKIVLTGWLGLPRLLRAWSLSAARE
ncbi:MAG: hypothetical protein FJX62_09275 [Alphaproteobacteria bacterium]|nr:hypothetical protein [Alphaproteobacteria bacterium]